MERGRGDGDVAAPGVRGAGVLHATEAGFADKLGRLYRGAPGGRVSVHFSDRWSQVRVWREIADFERWRHGWCGGKLDLSGARVLPVLNRLCESLVYI